MKKISYLSLRQSIQTYFHSNWRQLIEIVVELSIFIPLFFLPSLRLQQRSTYQEYRLLNLFSQYMNWHYEFVYILWAIVLGGLISIILLFRHRLLLYIYLILAFLRLSSFLIPVTWRTTYLKSMYLLDHILIYPLRVIIGVFIVFAVLGIFFGFPSLGSGGNSSDRELRAWQREAHEHKQRTGKDDYFG